jgi:ribosomal protein S4
MHIKKASAPKRPRVMKLWKQGHTELHIAQPGWKKNSVRQIQFITHQQIKYFYDLTDTQYKHLLIKAKELNLGFIPLIESRLDVLLFRLQFASSIFEARDLIKRGDVLVDLSPSLFSNHIISVGSQISVNPLHAVKHQLTFKTCQFKSTPSYLLKTKVNEAVLISRPSLNSISLSSNLDISKLPGAI